MCRFERGLRVGCAAVGNAREDGIGRGIIDVEAATLVCIALFVLVVAISKYVSLGSVVAMVLLPPVAGLLFQAPRPIVMAAAGAAVLIVLKHRENLKRLAAGSERRLGQK